VSTRSLRIARESLDHSTVCRPELGSSQAHLQNRNDAVCDDSVTRMRRGMQSIRSASAQDRRGCSFLFLY
jgi:hypothetical protein